MRAPTLGLISKATVPFVGAFSVLGSLSFLPGRHLNVPSVPTEKGVQWRKWQVTKCVSTTSNPPAQAPPVPGCLLALTLVTPGGVGIGCGETFIYFCADGFLSDELSCISVFI